MSAQQQPNDAALISTQNISRHFGGIKAVDQVSFALPEGEIRAIIGPNGAGKSTLVSLLCGRQQPTSGKVFFKGRDITRLPAHARTALGIAYTFQITSIFSNLTCYANVELAAQQQLHKRHQGSGAKALERATLEALDRVGLSDHVDATARHLSYGHQRLLEVAMGLALKPQLLMLDEPTQGLADAEIDNFISLIRTVAADATILLIEHNMDVVMQLAQTITVMDAGQILAEGTPAEIRANADVQQAYLGG
ncbi:MAG: ABC transporter ATP-binding protein [Gammaproteobacteria bacterium]|nr:ABC transporter ATP-binding protein [Gammaproteobacteria bacterium]